MRKKLMLWMMAVFVPLLLAVAFALTEWSFSLTMEREQNRVQMTESLIARQVQQTIDDLDYTALEEAARQYRSFYAAQGVGLHSIMGEGTAACFTTSLQPIVDSVTSSAVPYGQEVSEP